MPAAARETDPVEHSDAEFGFLLGMQWASMQLGGWAAGLGASVGEAIGSHHGGTKTGEIAHGSDNTMINDRPAARATADSICCKGTPPLYLPSHEGKRIASGSATVFINSEHSARVDDMTECGAKIQKGSDNVFIDGGTVKTLESASEVPSWMHTSLTVIELLSSAYFFGPLTTGLSYVASELGSWGLGKAAQAMGLNETWQKLFKLAGGLAGGLVGGMAASRWSSFIAEAKCSLALEPVDMGSGRVVDQCVDLALPGTISFIWRRHYSSSKNLEESTLGFGGWSHSYDQWVLHEANRTVLRDQEGRDVYYPRMTPGQTVLHRADRISLRAFEDGSFTAYSHETRLTRYFAPLARGGPAVLRAIEDAHGNTIRLDYRGRALHCITDTAGREIRVTSARGRVLRVEVWVDGALATWFVYGYTAAGELGRATDVAGYAEVYEYDAERRLCKKTLKNGVSFYYEYDRFSGWCCRSFGDGGLHEGWIEVDLKKRITYLTGNDEPRIYHWNKDGLVTREETPDGVLVGTWEYDEDLHLIAQSNGVGHTHRYEYDDRGNKIREIDPAGNVTEWRYDGDLLVTEIEPNGLRTDYRYGTGGETNSVEYPSGERRALAHDNKGRLLSVADAGRTLVAFEYDDRHNIVAETDACGSKTTFTYDRLGDALSQTDAMGRRVEIEYDVMRRPVSQHQPDGTVQRTAYDALGNPTLIRDPLGQTTVLTYSGTGWLASIKRPDGRLWTFAYTGNEKVRRFTNPRGEDHQIEYDTVGRVISEKTCDGRMIRYSYAGDGNLARIDYPDGSFRAFVRDVMGNLALEESDDAIQTYQRDRMGRVVSGTIVQSGNGHVVLFQRDALGHPIAETQGNQTVKYAYDGCGRRVQRVMPDGQTTSYTYGPFGRLVRLQHQDYVMSFERDALGRETVRQAGSGRVSVAIVHDAMDRLVEQRVTAPDPAGGLPSVLAERRWKYDALGRVTRIEDQRWGSTSYTYNIGGQLLTARRKTYREAFSYDAAGAIDGILSRVGAANDVGRSAPWEIAPGNLLAKTDGAVLAYDRRGRRVRRTAADGAVTEYAWDVRDRLREVRLPSGDRVVFMYDAFGRRIRKEVHLPFAPAPRVTEFLWDGDVLAADTDATQGLRTFVHEPETFVPLLQCELGHTYVYVNDHLGTPKELVDEWGEVVWAVAHASFGRIVEVRRPPQKSPGGEPPVRSPFRLLGQYVDDETGLSYTRFRYFDEATARWLSPDPIGLLGGPDMFCWAGTPVNTTDPLGLAPSCGLRRSERIRTMNEVEAMRRADAEAEAMRRADTEAERMMLLPSDAEFLTNFGRIWAARVWLGGDYAARNWIINRINNWLRRTGISVGRGWQPYDPVVRSRGPRRYLDIAADLDRDPQGNAQTFAQFMDGELSLAEMSPALQELAVITHFAEVGRGYSSSLANLRVFLDDVAAGRARWSDINDYFEPSLTYAQNVATEWDE